MGILATEKAEWIFLIPKPVPGARYFWYKLSVEGVMDRIMRMLKENRDLFSDVFAALASFGLVNSRVVALKLLANVQIADLPKICTLFSDIEAKASRVPFARERFCDFIFSIFEAVITNATYLSQVLAVAKKLIEWWAVRSDEELLSLGGEDETCFSKQVEFYSFMKENQLLERLVSWTAPAVITNFGNCLSTCMKELDVYCYALLTVIGW
jgi:hypothetical protein